MLASWTALIVALGFGLDVAAHGVVTNFTVDGQFFKGYYQLQREGKPNRGPAWDTPGLEVPTKVFALAPIFDSEFQSPDFVCHKGATPPPNSVKVGPGSEIVFQWPDWPHGHHGPIITMMANCNGSCVNVDKTKLRWNTLEQVGLIDPKLFKYPSEDFASGFWASDQLIKDHDTWTFKVPAGIAPGNYVLRHDMIALHNAIGGMANPGPQFYPNCFSIEMTGSGADPLSGGTLAKDLYNVNEPGLRRGLWIFRKDFLNYTIPGPAVYTPKMGLASNTSHSSPAAQNSTESPNPTPISSSMSTSSSPKSCVVSKTPATKGSHTVPTQEVKANTEVSDGSGSGQGMQQTKSDPSNTASTMGPSPTTGTTLAPVKDSGGNQKVDNQALVKAVEHLANGIHELATDFQGLTTDVEGLKDVVSKMSAPKSRRHSKDVLAA